MSHIKHHNSSETNLLVFSVHRILQEITWLIQKHRLKLYKKEDFLYLVIVSEQITPVYFDRNRGHSRIYVQTTLYHRTFSLFRINYDAYPEFLVYTVWIQERFWATSTSIWRKEWRNKWNTNVPFWFTRKFIMIMMPGGLQCND